MPKAGRLYGQSLITERGVTQGVPVSPIVFNIVLDEVVSVVLLEVCGPEKA